MTQTYIISGIIAIICALVCYIFIRQTISERKLERERLQRALNKRAKELMQAIGLFPEDFLPKELEVFLYRCIIDVYEQLIRLAPTEKGYVEALQAHTAQLEFTVRKPEGQVTEDLQSTSQINEFKQYLSLIGNFLQKSTQRGQITERQHSHYRSLLKELVIKLTVNGHVISAQQSIEMQKLKLALHYYDLAKNLLIKEKPAGCKVQIQKLNTRAQPLLERVQAEEADVREENKHPRVHAPEPSDKKPPRDTFEEESGWKKKNVYD